MELRLNGQHMNQNKLSPPRDEESIGEVCSKEKRIVPTPPALKVATEKPTELFLSPHKRNQRKYNKSGDISLCEPLYCGVMMPLPENEEYDTYNGHPKIPLHDRNVHYIAIH
jgi:hypothetical protein